MMWLLWSLIIAAGVALDRVTKVLTVEYLKPIGDIPLIDGWLHLHYLENTGAAFGMMKGQREIFLIASTVGILAILGVLFWKGKDISLIGTIALCLIVSGGIGNQIDRIAQGYVVDMIYVKVIDFAVFNLADAFVCVGVGIMVVCLFTVDRFLIEDDPKSKKSPKRIFKKELAGKAPVQTAECLPTEEKTEQESQPLEENTAPAASEADGQEELNHD